MKGSSMAASINRQIQDLLKTFASEVQSNAEAASRLGAQPEDQLKAPVESLVRNIGTLLGKNLTVLTEARLQRIGRPDMAILEDGLLIGYVELKAPGVGTTESRFRGRDRTQFSRFRALPNLIYTDGIEWSFYRRKDDEESNAYQRGYRVTIEELVESGKDAVEERHAQDMLSLFREFLNWMPSVPSSAKALAQVLAPLTRMLRSDVIDAVKLNGVVKGVYEDWKRTLFPEATKGEFADSYAQTVTYGLLLARLSGSHVLDTRDAADAIADQSGLLARTLEILMQAGTQQELGAAVDLLRRTIDAVDPKALGSKGKTDPWLYFYEDFLTVYDPKLRNERGVYYTPWQVVQAQVRLVDDVLRTYLNRPDGIADKDVTILDPALGTGTYLLSALQHGVDTMAVRYGPGVAQNAATQMAKNLYGFELLVGPYAVANVRLTQLVHELGGTEPKEGMQVYLTDTLESPHGVRKAIHSQFDRPLAEEHRRAIEVKAKQKIMVCMGNPPYERKDGDGSGTVDTAGGWIRFGDDISSTPPLETFLEPARRAGAAKYLRNMYNAYVYFWRWAMWKVLETQKGPGVVCFITASSYLQGRSFVGMREEMRRSFDEIWIIDLGGDGRGTRRSENVFDILSPVAIGIGVRTGKGDRKTAATVRYVCIAGTRAEMFNILEGIEGLSGLNWEQVDSGWTEAFVPTSSAEYVTYPALTDLFPWQSPGAKLHRSWPIANSDSVLKKRWNALIASQDRSSAFRETRDRTIHGVYQDQLGGSGMLKPVRDLTVDDEMPPIVDYGFRTFDLHRIFRDTRVGDFYRPPLWNSMSERQMYLTTLISSILGAGSSASIAPAPPDLHHFNGRGGKDVIPLYRNASATQPNITNGLLDALGIFFGFIPSPEELIAYVVGIMGSPAYSSTFEEELETPGPRVPITKNGQLFKQVAAIGRKVIAYQTYGHRFGDAIGSTPGYIPQGTSRLTTGIPDSPKSYPGDMHQVKYDDKTRELQVGDGIVSHVAPEVWEYELSGFRPVRSWIAFRVKNRAGRKSSPLDKIRPESWDFEMTEGLMQLLWAIEGVIALEPEQADLLAQVLEGELFLESELPTPTDAERAAPIFDAPEQQRLL